MKNLPDIKLAIAYIEYLTEGTAVIAGKKPITHNDCEIEFEVINLGMTFISGVNSFIRSITRTIGVTYTPHHTPLKNSFIWNYGDKKVVLSFTPLTMKTTISLIQ
jgi:hypothetical protein